MNHRLPRSPRPQTLRRGLLGAALLASSTVGYAEAPEAQQVVVTAARVEQPLPDTLPSTRVITRADIEAVQSPDLPALLRDLTSLDVAQSGPFGSQTSVFVRGADSRQVLVLIDGVPYARADVGAPSWQYLPLEQIERVEIVRGNLSAMYGAQAVGGVVQIFTRRAGAPQATLGAGSHGTLSASAAAGATVGEGPTALDVSASASHRRTDGYNAGDLRRWPSANPDDDGARQSGASLRAEKGWAPGHVTALIASVSRTRSEYDGYTPNVDDVLQTATSMLGLQSHHALGGGIEASLDLGQTTERFTDPTGFVTRGNNRIRQAGVGLEWQAAAGQQGQLGVDHKRETYAANGDPATTRNTDGVRAGWLASFGDVDLQANLRHDRSDDYGDANTGLLALGWRFAPGWRLSVQGGNAFSAPSFSDIAYAAPGQALRPERSRNAEIGVRWAQQGWLARVSVFVQRQSDKIAFDPATFNTVNIARASNRGLELQFDVPLAIGQFGGEATWQDPRDRDTGQLLKRRSRESAVLSYRVPVAGWQAGAWLRYTGQRLDVDPVTFVDAVAPARTTLALTAQRALSAAWRIAGRVDNVGNSHAPEVLGYTPPPRTFSVELTGAWQ